MQAGCSGLGNAEAVVLRYEMLVKNRVLVDSSNNHHSTTCPPLHNALNIICIEGFDLIGLRPSRL